MTQVVYCANPLRFFVTNDRNCPVPAVVIGGKPEELEEISDNIPEIISFNLEYVGCLAAMRLHERIINPRLGISRKFIPAGDAFWLDSETDAQSL